MDIVQREMSTLGDTSNTTRRLFPLDLRYLYRALSSLSSSRQIFQLLLDHYLLEKGKWPQFHVCSLDITFIGRFDL